MADEIEVSEEQRSHAVWRHPQRDMLHALMRRGRTPEWIAAWLEEQYPVEDEEGVPHPDYRRNRKLRVSRRTLDRYRARFMPEVSPGIDLIRSDIEDLVGRRPPLPAGRAAELDRLENLSAVGEHILQMSLAADADLEMVQQTTLEALKAVVEIQKTAVELKSKLGLPGYEAAVVETKASIDQRVEQTTHNVNVELVGRNAPSEKGEGAGPPNKPTAVSALMDLMQQPPEAVKAMIEAAEAQVIDGTAEVDETPEQETTDA
jgi:hypothetical protein